MATTQIARTVGRPRLLVAIDPKEVGRRIKAARERKGWTQLEFAYAAKVSPSSISRWERGLLPPVRELMRIAGVLDVDVSELVEEQHAPVTQVDEQRLREIIREEIAPLLEARIEDDPPLPRTDGAGRPRAAGGRRRVR